MNEAARSQALNDVMTALADPTRRAIVERLSRGEARVTELAEPFSISLNSVSKHIRMLERAKIVRRHVRGREHLLSLDPRPLGEVTAWIDAQRALWLRRLSALDDLLREEDRDHAPKRGRR
jgi:DNA-binding transcriptional ArsR family regulator